MCGAYSAIGVRHFHEKRDGHGVVPFSPPALYALVKDLERRETGLEFDGVYIRDVLRIMKGSGTPLQDGTRDGKISTYYRVPSGTAAFKAALFNSQVPLYFRIDWDRNWMSLPYNKVVKTPINDIIGGHALYIWGWDDNVNGGSWLIRNSWGRWSTAGNGNAYLAYRFLANRNPEAWVSVDVLHD
jgi:hypothetical protein